MTAKEYLGQAYRIDQRINSKMEQVAALRSLATKATAIPAPKADNPVTKAAARYPIPAALPAAAPVVSADTIPLTGKKIDNAMTPKNAHKL